MLISICCRNSTIRLCNLRSRSRSDGEVLDGALDGSLFA